MGPGDIHVLFLFKNEVVDLNLFTFICIVSYLDLLVAIMFSEHLAYFLNVVIIVLRGH